MLLMIDKTCFDTTVNKQSNGPGWSRHHRSVLDRRSRVTADLDAAEVRRDHTPSQRTLERLGFATALARPNYSAQRRLATSTARIDTVNPDWRPL